MMNKQNIIVVLTQVLFITALFNLPFLAQAHHTPIVTNVAKDPTDLPLLPQGNGLVTVNLQIQELLAEVAILEDEPDEQQKTLVWTFDGTVPGKMIRIREGNTVEFIVTNAVNNHFTHDVMVPAANGAEVTLDESGGTKKFTFHTAGAYIYQGTGGGDSLDDRASGLYGLIVVEPTGGFTAGYTEFYIAVSEWFLKEAEPEENPHHTENTLVLDAGREDVSLWTLNGHQFALKDPALFGESIRTNQGGKARFFFLNAGTQVESNWHIIGTVFSQVIQDFDHPVRNEETVLIPPGGAAIFELDTPVPGTFLIVDHALFRVPQGNLGFLNVDPVGAFPSDIYDPQP